MLVIAGRRLVDHLAEHQFQLGHRAFATIFRNSYRFLKQALPDLSRRLTRVLLPRRIA